MCVVLAVLASTPDAFGGPALGITALEVPDTAELVPSVSVTLQV